MALENLLVTLVLSLGLGAGAAILAKYGSGEDWDNRKFAFALALGAISGLTVVETQFDGLVTEANATKVVLAIFGAAFVGTKGISIVNKIRTTQ